MGLGYVIVLERDLDGIDPRTIDGRTLAKHRHTIDAFAHEMDLPGLGEFVAFSEVEAEALAEDMKFDAPPVGSGRWFEPVNGLEVVQSIRSYMRDNPDEVEELDDVDAIVKGLDAFERVLDAARVAKTRFRFSIEY